MKDIKDYEGLYGIDENGVWSYRRKKYLKSSPNSSGYPTLKLYKDGKGKTFFLHRLIAEYLIPNPDNLPQVDHIDGNPLNYSPNNLRWVSVKENNNNPIHKARCSTRKTKVCCIELNQVFNSMTEAAQAFNISPSRISECCRGVCKTAGGYHWQLAEIEEAANGLSLCGVIQSSKREDDETMSVFRINKTNNFTIMSNTHFKEKKMSLKAKGLLSLMLSLPDDWDYSIAGLATLSKDGKDSVMSALAELEKFGYLTRRRLTNEKGQFAGVEYNIYENPVSAEPNEDSENLEKPNSEKPAQLNTNLTNHLFDLIFTLLNTNDPELIALYREYIQMRDKINSPLTEMGLEKLIERAKRLSKGNERIEKLLLESAIINNWKNVYPPRESELERMSDDMRSEMKAFFGIDEY